MWKLLFTTLLLASLIFSAYYLYRLDKTNIQDKTSSTSSQTETIDQSEQPEIPIYLTEGFWQTVTPQKLENQLKNITDINKVRPDNKKSMLHLLAEYGNNPEIVKMLILGGVDYNLRDTTSFESIIYNRKALFYAIIRENQAYEFSQALLEYDDANSYVDNNTPALMLATYWRKHKIVQALLKKGADPNLKSSSQSNALMSASATNRITEDSYIDPNTIQLLLDHNADIKAKNKAGKSAFDFMKENEAFKQTELFKKLSNQLSQ